MQHAYLFDQADLADRPHWREDARVSRGACPSALGKACAARAHAGAWACMPQQPHAGFLVRGAGCRPARCRTASERLPTAAGGCAGGWGAAALSPLLPQPRGADPRGVRPGPGRALPAHSTTGARRGAPAALLLQASGSRANAAALVRRCRSEQDAPVERARLTVGGLFDRPCRMGFDATIGRARALALVLKDLALS